MKIAERSLSLADSDIDKWKMAIQQAVVNRDAYSESKTAAISGYEPITQAFVEYIDSSDPNKSRVIYDDWLYTHGLAIAESIVDRHYQRTRSCIVASVSEIESAVTARDSEALAIKLVSALIYAGSENIDRTLLDMKPHVPKRGFAFLVAALGFVALGNADTAVVQLLETLRTDENIHVREAAENSLDMIDIHGELT